MLHLVGFRKQSHPPKSIFCRHFMPSQEPVGRIRLLGWGLPLWLGEVVVAFALLPLMDVGGVGIGLLEVPENGSTSQAHWRALAAAEKIKRLVQQHLIGLSWQVDSAWGWYQLLRVRWLFCALLQSFTQESSPEEAHKSKSSGQNCEQSVQEVQERWGPKSKLSTRKWTPFRAKDLKMGQRISGLHGFATWLLLTLLFFHRGFGNNYSQSRTIPSAKGRKKNTAQAREASAAGQGNAWIRGYSCINIVIPMHQKGALYTYPLASIYMYIYFPVKKHWILNINKN